MFDAPLYERTYSESICMSCADIFLFLAYLYGYSVALLARELKVVNLVGGRYVGTLLSADNTSEGTWVAVMLLPTFALMRSVYYGR